MKVSRAQAALHREMILDEAAKLFREKGFDGIGVSDLMKSVGLTHGGFYGHFASKEQLMAEACRRAVTSMLEQWNRLAATAPENPLGAIAHQYFSTAHRDNPGRGCLMATLGPEVSRQPPVVRRAVTECLEDVLGTLTRLAPGESPAAKRQYVMRLFASMVGAIVVARAVNKPPLSKEFLEVVGADASPAPKRARRLPTRRK